MTTLIEFSQAISFRFCFTHTFIDEPSLGLAPNIVDRVYEVLTTLREERGMTLLIVEQSSERALKAADRLYVIRNGEIQMGRPDYWVGAHVYGFNEISLGVCLIGRDIFTENQFNSLKIVLRMWKKNYPNAKIIGHCDLPNTEKTCPNFEVSKWYRDNDS